VLGTLLAADVPDPENKKGEPLRAWATSWCWSGSTRSAAPVSRRSKVFAGYTSLDLREDAQPTTTAADADQVLLAFDVADPMGKSSAGGA